MDRWTRAVNATLLTLFVFTVATGALAFAIGAAPLETVVVGAHGVAGFGLLVLVPAKARIARRGLRRPGRSRKVISWTLSVLVIAAIAGGLLHAIRGFAPVLGLLPMQIHVGAALAAAAGGLALWAVAPGRARRFTGSHEVSELPVTQWLFDPVLALDPTAWRLRLLAGPLDLDALAALPQTTVRAVIDCTGGWWAEEEWQGVLLTDLGLPATALDVVSATGYRRRLPGPDGVLLATHAGGRPLTDGHGGPARLVVPGRRGFWWVKWVVAVEPTDEPWWWQPPLPLQ